MPAKFDLEKPEKLEFELSAAERVQNDLNKKEMAKPGWNEMADKLPDSSGSSSGDEEIDLSYLRK